MNYKNFTILIVILLTILVFLIFQEVNAQKADTNTIPFYSVYFNRDIQIESQIELEFKDVNKDILKDGLEFTITNRCYRLYVPEYCLLFTVKGEHEKIADHLIFLINYIRTKRNEKHR